MSTDSILITLFVVLVAMLGFAIFRNRDMPRANVRILRSNEQVIENRKRLIALQERSTAAMERIAEALEKR